MSFATKSNRTLVGLLFVTATFIAASSVYAQSDFTSDNATASTSGPSGYDPGSVLQGQAAVINSQAAALDSLGNYEINRSQSDILSEQARNARLDNNLK